MAPMTTAAHVAHPHAAGPSGWAFSVIIIVVVASVLRWVLRGRGGAVPGGQRSGTSQPPPPPWWTAEDERSWQARQVAPFARQAQGLRPFHGPSRDHLRPPG